MEPKKFSEIKSLVHSYGEWNALGPKPLPYCFEIENENQLLYYFGANHSRNINNEQFLKLENYWKSFLEKTREKNKVVLVEGGMRKVWDDKKTAVLKDSEAGFITLLASKEGVRKESPEPDAKLEREYLLQSYANDEIQYYYFARVIPAWHQLPEPRQEFSEFMKTYRSSIKEGSYGPEWADYDFSLENMKKVHKKIFGSEFNENDKNYIKSVINPTTEKTIINKVARASSTFRNVYIVSRIEELWKNGESIFVVFGMAHPILQERALKKLLV